MKFKVGDIISDITYKYPRLILEVKNDHYEVRSLSLFSEGSKFSLGFEYVNLTYFIVSSIFRESF